MMKIIDEKLFLIQIYSEEFEAKYLVQPKGQNHLSTI